jgi:hypothetical protein
MALGKMRSKIPAFAEALVEAPDLLAAHDHLGPAIAGDLPQRPHLWRRHVLGRTIPWAA